ncbi:MAG: hypothetical protein M0Z61_08290 [Nitrospiraceae bacterium]|nr:hypothetical protein [Nitrospiraceae bacterium]
MRRNLRILLFLALAFLLDMKLSIHGFRPDLVIFIVYWFGYSRSGSRGLLFGAAAGAVEDSLFMGMLGPGILSMGIAGFFASFLSMSFFRWTPFLGFFGAMGLTLAAGFVELATLSFFGHGAEGILSGGIVILLAQSVLNGVLGYFLRPETSES